MALSQVEQALVNLVVNSRDALPQGGTVTIKTALRTVTGESPASGALPRPGQYVAVIVEDNGTGMSSQTLDHIFEPFFTTKPRGTDTGLGLSTVISIARGCGGGVEVKSQLGAGTSFILYFPLYSGAGAPGVVVAPEHVTAPGSDIPSI